MSRQQQIVRTGYLGIATNVLVATGKAIVGAVSGSMAIVLDAVNNLTDALSSVITIIGVKLAGRPADDKHPFGYGRIEYFTAVIIAAMVLIAGGTSLVESVKGTLSPSEQEYSIIGIAIIAVTIVVKFSLGFYTKKKGKELSSDALISSGADSMFDSIISIATIISAIIMLTTGWSIDCWLAAIISCIIIKAGIEMVMSPISELLGVRSDPELTGGIKSRVKTIEGVHGVYDVVLHDYGPEQKMGALHVEVDDTLSAAELHRLTKHIQKLVRIEFGIFVTIGFYAKHHEGSGARHEEEIVRQYVNTLEGAIGMHGFYINHEDKMLSFDVVYSFSLARPISLREHLTEWLQEKYAGYDINIGLDRNFSE